MQKTMTCPRCNGKGKIKDYRSYLGGVCFRCNGTGIVAYRKASNKTKAPDPSIEIENNRRFQRAMEIYSSDTRLRVPKGHPYFYAHCRELALLDGVWEKL